MWFRFTIYKSAVLFLCTLTQSAAATVANVKIRYDAKTLQFSIFETHIICVFYSICICIPAYLNDPTEVAVCSELEALFLGPDLYPGEASLEAVPPRPGAQHEARLQHQLVEEPHVDVVEELGEQLDGQRRVHSAPTQQRHSGRQCLENFAWKSNMVQGLPLLHTFQSLQNIGWNKKCPSS